MYLHELGHMYNGGGWSAAGDNGGRAIAWLYLAELIDGGTGCRVHELYADAIMVATQPTASATYYTPCSETGDSPSSATLTMIRSVLNNEIPAWFSDNYTFGEGDAVPYDTSTLRGYSASYDLEEFWADLFSIPAWQFAAVAALRDAFGGYCNNNYAAHAAYNRYYLRNPWKIGGCTPRAPTVSLDASGGVTWTAPYDGGRAITKYVVQWKDYDQGYHSSRRAEVSATSNFSYATGRTSGGSSVRVAGVSLFGEGKFGEVSQPAVAPSKPNAPTVVSRDKSLVVWLNAPFSGGSPITSYDLRYIESEAEDKSDDKWSKLIPAWTSGRLRASIDQLTNDTGYDVQIRAVNIVGAGEWSDTSAGTPISSDNTLAQLLLSEGRFSPAFDGAVDGHTASVGNTVTQITVTPVLNDDDAALEIVEPDDADSQTAGHQVSLPVGTIEVVIKVTAANDDVRTYTIWVKRTGPDTSLTPAASDPNAPFFSEAVYTLTFQGGWTTDVTPDGVPTGAHFSRLIGAVHNASVSFLESGGTASAGVESMAELGGTSTLESEVQTAIDADPATALSVLRGSTDTGGVGATQTLNPTLSTAHPRVTLVTMIAPSPDWFAGVSGLPLLNTSGRWLRSHSLNLYPWDAGTAEGTGFSLSNAETDPKVAIHSIRGTGKFSTEQIATLSFELQSVSTTRSVAENTAAGINLGAPIRAVATSGSVAYTLGGADSSSFQIVSSSGQLRTRDALDFETKERYEVTVTDIGGSVDTVVTIDVTNLEESGAWKLSSMQPVVASVLTATLTDPDIISTVAWKWERSTSRSSGWQLITGATSSSYTPEAADEDHYLRVTATYTDGFSADKSLSLVSQNKVEPQPPVNTAPTFSSSSTTRSVPENSGQATRVGERVTATDLEHSALNYSLAGPDASSFTINNVNGQILVAAGAQLDHEADEELDITVTANDPLNATGSINVTIEITDVNERPEAVRDDAVTDEDMSVTIDVLENDSDPENDADPANHLLTVQVRADPEDGDATVEADGRITYTPNANFDESDQFRYRVRDDQNLYDEAWVTVAITAINDAPVFLAATVSRSVVATAAMGDPVGAPVKATDVDEGDTLTYSLEGADALDFDIDNDGQITIASGTILDISDKDMYEVTVVVFDEAGISARTDVTITLTGTPVTQPPVGGGGGVVVGGGGGGGGGGGPTPSEVDFEWTVQQDIEALDSGHDSPTGAWSDGSILWIAENGDGADDAVYAYDLATGERVEEREFELDEANRAPRGFWSNGEIAWVADSGQERLFAYDLASGDRDEAREVELHSRNRDARAIWSDREIMWVLDGGKDRLFAYDLATAALVAEYALDEANDDPRGLWSDGVTVWVSDHGEKRLFAYRLPVPEEKAETSEVEVAQDGAGALERVRDEEFPSTVLSRASNNSPRGLWSDGDVMYVADESDGKVYTYNMPDAIDARLASLSISGVDIGEFDPGTTDYEGLIAEGVTETIVTAQAMQRRAHVATDPPDSDGDDANGYQVALEDLGEITVTVTSADGSRTKTYRVAFGETEQESTLDPWPHCLRGDVAVGFSLVVYEGGSVEELDVCAESRQIVALYALYEGVYVSYILGAPDFVNQQFRDLFLDGVPATTSLIAGSSGPSSEDPVGDDAVAWPDGAGCLDGDVAEGFSLVIYEGGSVEDLDSCARSRGVTAFYTLVEGEWVSYILRAPEFVNRPFVELFPDGLPAVTPLVAKSDSPSGSDVDGDGTSDN